MASRAGLAVKICWKCNILFSMCLFGFCWGCQGEREHRACPGGMLPCSGECVDIISDDGNCGWCGNACDRGESCVLGRCRCGGVGPDCEGLQACCGTSCVDVRGDVGNCGGCGVECRADEECVQGACGCGRGYTDCGGVCVDLATDPENCGFCGVSCDTGEECVFGICRCGGSGPDCGGVEVCCGVSCVDLRADGDHCGSCGNACDPGESCVSGECRCGGSGGDCDAPLTCCGTSCVDLQGDAGNCGGCGVVCDAGESCDLGHCRCGGGSCDEGEECVEGECRCGGTGPDCGGFLTCCGADCVDLNTDAGNCGSCGNLCSLPEAVAGCVDGACVIEQCNGGFENCDLDTENGCETDVMTDSENCGICTVRCDAGEQCVGGKCRCGGVGPECFDENICCGAACINPLNDEHNCGGCGVACDVRELCVEGECRCGGVGPDCGAEQVCCCTGCVDLDGLGDPCGGCAPACVLFEECVCGVCVDLGWVYIPGSVFMMGSPEGVGEDNEHPRHEVTVPDFEMMRSEVTISQYQRCVESGVCSEPNYPGEWGVGSNRCNWGIAGREDHPVLCVDWHQAVDFCIWAGGRLPTEAEWEYAARSGGREITYPWGNEAATCEYAVMYFPQGLTHPSGCGLHRAWPVCSKPAGDTAQGLCDMAGNAWEWVRDYMHYDYVGAPSDGSAWEDPSSHARVTRGGAWDIHRVRAALRQGCTPDGRFDPLGFRCARDPGVGCAAEACRCGDGYCEVEESCCGGTCVDLQRDSGHCGSCGRACGAGDFCVGGVCWCGEVGPGEEVCNHEDDDCDGEVDEDLAGCGCTGGSSPALEVCDGVDNDCDGSVDEDNGYGKGCGGFEEPCGQDRDCVSGICVGDEFIRYCTVECDAGAPGSCPAGYRCVIGPRVDQCLFDFPACGSNQDCAPEEVCTVRVADDGVTAVTECRPPIRAAWLEDRIGPGEACGATVPGPCDNGLCYDSICSEVCGEAGDCGDLYLDLETVCVLENFWWRTDGCGRDEQCPAGYVCREGDCVGPACAVTADCEPGHRCDPDELVCRSFIWFDYAGICRIGCARDADCPEGLVCQFSVLVDLSSAQGHCEVPNPLGGPVGAACDSKHDCDHNLCMRGRCTLLCAGDPDCPEGTTCTPRGLPLNGPDGLPLDGTGLFQVWSCME